MARKVQYFCKETLADGILIINYIIDGRHDVKECMEEFECSKETINKKIQIVGYAAFYDDEMLKGFDCTADELKKKYILAKKILDILKRRKESKKAKESCKHRIKHIPATEAKVAE